MRPEDPVAQGRSKDSCATQENTTYSASSSQYVDASTRCLLEYVRNALRTPLPCCAHAYYYVLLNTTEFMVELMTKIASDGERRTTAALRGMATIKREVNK